MATFTRFDKYKLPTEFLDGRFKHTILASPSRVETWERVERLGVGGFGTVHKERCCETGAVRAVKEIRKALAKSNEIGVLTKLSSYPQHFVQLVGWFEDKLNIYLAMEFLECGDLECLMKDEELTESDAKSVAIQVLEGLEIMHQNNLCHRDLKPGNILISRWMPLTVKIADFGVSKHFDGFTEGRTFTGSRKYMAPEIWGILQSDTNTYTTAVDVWSLGCMVYAMLTKEPPFPEPRGLIDYVQGRVRFPPKELENVSTLAVEFMASLLMPLPADRATAEQARQHSWVLVEPGDDTVWTMLPSRRSSRVGSFTAETSPRIPVMQEEEEGEKRAAFPSSASIFNVHKSRLPSSFEPTRVGVLPKQPQTMTIPTPTRKGPKEDAMIAAAGNGHIALVRDILDRGADLNSSDHQGRTALFRAAYGNHHALIQYLLERGAPSSQGNGEGITAIHIAAQWGNLATMEFLLAHGAGVNERSLDGRDPLYFAVISGDLECVKFIVRSGADIKHRDRHGYSPLHIAVERAHIVMIDYLISLGFDVMEELVDGRAALDLAAESCNYDIIKFLVKKGADVSHRDHSMGMTALQRVAQEGSLPSAVYLLKHGAKANEMTSNGRTPLFFACVSNNVDLVQYLMLNGGGKISDRTDEGYTSLHSAAQSGHVPMIEFVLAQGVSVTEPTNDNRTPLYFATMSGSLDAVLFLLKNGAEIRCVADSGMTLLMMAAVVGHIPLIDFFISRGLGIEETDRVGFNALHIAAKNGHLKAFQHFLMRGANIMATTDKGDTALTLAGEMGHSDIVTYILENLETGNTATATPPPGTHQSLPPATYPQPNLYPQPSAGSRFSVGSRLSAPSVNSQADMAISSVGASTSSKKTRSKGINSRIKSWFSPNTSSSSLSP
ncbi:kinase-like domain-containing protein [Morchella snyderi]|nr:kinase-like domain-containing protein [Morchella snyderi]